MKPGSGLLALKIATSLGSPAKGPRADRADSSDVAGQSYPGQPEDSGRTGQTWSRSLRCNGSQVSPQGRAQAALADVASVSPQSHEATHRRRLLHCVHDLVPRLIFLCRIGPRAQEGVTFCGHRGAFGNVGRAANRQRVPFRNAAEYICCVIAMASTGRSSPSA